MHCTTRAEVIRPWIMRHSKKALLVGLVFTVPLLALSCKNSEPEATAETAQSIPPEDGTLAVDFMNAYIATFGQDFELEAWLKRSDMVTDEFITTLRDLLAEADPDMGLGFDPILNGQDYPRRFELDSFDAGTGYAVVRGIDWPSFKVTLKIVKTPHKWLIDGAGIINIPQDKQFSN